MTVHRRLLVPLLLLALPWRGASGQTASAPANAPPPAAVDSGRRIFHSVGGCLGCHGAKLQGTALAPTLREHKWRNGDGSLAAIITIVSNGVPHTLMVSHPGRISDAQVHAVASYVWAVSHGRAEP